MKKYSKIQSVWKRDPLTNYKTFIDELSVPEFAVISEWEGTEKVDGTNIRIIWDPETETAEIRGRSDAACLSPALIKAIESMIDTELFALKLTGPVTIYGEGFGAGIQKNGGDYGDKSFVAFDVWAGTADDGVWMRQEMARGIVDALNLPFVPCVFKGDLTTAAEIVAEGMTSLLQTEGNKAMSEGMVLRPAVGDLFLADGSRLITKLKTVDFPEGFNAVQSD